MKKIVSLIAILFLFSLKLKSQNTENGYTLPVQGEIKVLIIWAKKTNTFTNPSSISGYGEGILPIGADDFFDPSFTPGIDPSSYITKYFYEQSFGQYIVTGDYINHVVEVSNVSSTGGYAEIYNYLNELDINGQLQGKIANGSPLTDFDKYSINSSNNFLPKPNSGDGKIDVVIIHWIDNSLWVGGGHGLTPTHCSSCSQIGPFIGVNTDASFSGGWGLNDKKFTIQEYFHGMYGGNEWHTGAGAGTHTFMNFTNPWGIPTQMAGAGISNVVNGWDRNHIGWKGWLDKDRTIQKSILISALDQSASEVNTDMTISTNLGSGLFVLRDHVLYGDAIRIKLPHLQEDPTYPSAKNQYLWIENHQRLTTFDHGQHEDLPQEEPGQTCKDFTLPGLWAFVQVGKDNKGPNNIFSSTSSANGQGSWIFPLTAEGNYDFKYLNPHNPGWVNCVWNNNTIEIDKYDPTTLQNPFLGFSDIFNFYNSNGDNILSINSGDSYQPGASERVGGTTVYNIHARGDHEDAFNFSIGKTKISLSNNPSATPVYTYNNPNPKTNNTNLLQYQAPYENRSVWLNGISVEIIQENYDPSNFGPGAILVKVRMDEYEVNQPVRWCGNIKVSPNDFDPTPSDFSDDMYAINIEPGGSILLDRSKSYTRHFSVDQNPITNEYRFSEPTEMTILPNAYFHMEGGTSIVVDGESTLRVKGNARLEIHEYGTITVKKGSKLIIENNAQLVLWDNALIKIEQGGTLEYDNSDIELLGNNSVIEFEGNLSIANNADFTFTGDGYVKFSQQGWINSVTNPSNLIAGSGSSITLNGSGTTDKVLEVTQESLYAFSPLVKFTLNNGLAALGNDSRICVEGILDMQNSTITSNTGNNINHRGLNLFGQPNVTINNCKFQHGKYGIYAILSYGGSPITISNSEFFSNDLGLVSIDKGVNLINCSFSENVYGWDALGMTFPSTANQSSFNSNIYAGIRYQSTVGSNLLLKNSSVNLNELNGVEFDGPSMLTIRCGSVFDNYNYGVLISNNSILNTTPQVSPYGGKVNLSGNSTGVFADCANNWLTVGGRNNFTSDYKVAQGKFNLPCNYSIPANFNRWKTALTSPVINTNFKLKGCNCNPNTNILLSDPNPINQLFCPVIWSPTPQQKNLLSHNNPLEHCPGCERITTTDFNNVKLDLAVEESLKYVEFGKDSLTGIENDLKAINLLSQILKYRYNNGNKFNLSISDNESWLLELSNQKMKEALSNAYLNSKLSGDSNPEVEMVISTLDSIYKREFNIGQFDKALYASLDKVGVYKLIGKRQDALYELANISSCLPLDSIQEVYITKLKNLLYAENQLVNGDLAKQDFEKYLNKLNEQAVIESGFTIANSPSDSLFANVYLVGDTINFKTFLPGMSVNWNFGDCTTGVGSVVTHIFSSSGIYDVSCTINTSCGSKNFISKITVLPDFSMKIHDTLIASQCDREQFSVSGRILSIDNFQNCYSSGFVNIDTSKIRYKINWNFDVVSTPDNVEYISFNNAQLNPLNSYRLDFTKSDTSFIFTNIIMQYFDENDWRDVSTNRESSDTVVSDLLFSVLIEMDTLICQLDSVYFQTEITGGLGPLDYHWVFSNGFTSHDANPITLFKEGGLQNLSVEISDINGCQATISFPYGSSHSHFNMMDTVIHSHSEFDFEIPNCPTISGYLVSNDPCQPLVLSNVYLNLIDKERNMPLTRVFTDDFGRFQFKPSEVALLNQNTTFLLTLLHPKEYYLVDRILANPVEFINNSPFEVRIASTKIDTIKRNSIPYDTTSITAINGVDGKIYSASTISNLDSKDFYLEKSDSIGNVIWSKAIDYGYSKDSLISMCLDSLCNSYMIGTTWNGNDHDYFSVKLDSTGNIIWSIVYEDSLGTDDLPIHICVEEGDKVCISGSNIYTNRISYSNIVYKECGPETRNSSLIQGEKDELVELLKFEIYPNPNSGNDLIINSPYATENNVRLNVFNLNGQLIFSTNLNNGINKMNLNFNSGIYPIMIYGNENKILHYDKLVIIQE